MLPPQPVTLARGRVVLTPWEESHDASLLQAAQDDEVWRWLLVLRPRTVRDVAALRTSHPGLPWVVVVDDVPAGSTSYLDVDAALGCRYDGTLRHHRVRPDGTVRDTVFYSMLAAEWPVAKTGLLARLG